MFCSLISDVHLEFNKDKSKFIKELDSTGIDVLIIAGDFATQEYLGDCLIEICKKYPNVVFVPGNHEYYRSSKEEVEATLNTVENVCNNFHWLRPGKVFQLKDVVFFGSTMWYKYDPLNDLYCMALNDYHLIKDHKYWVYKENEAHRKWIYDCLKTFQCKKVVVTHHSPSGQSIEGRYIGSELNRFYVCKMENAILDYKPNIWCHGHMHYAKDYIIGDTRVLANPRGYSYKDGTLMEPSRFDKQLRFEI